MEELLQSIGALSLVIGFGYFVLKRLDIKGRQEREAKVLFPYSDKVKEAAGKGATTYELV